MRRAPEPDEYEPEEQELLARLDEAATVSAADRLARDVFGRWFGTGGRPRAHYIVAAFHDLAKELAILAEKRRQRSR